MKFEFEPKVGYVLLRDVRVKQSGPTSFEKKKHAQPALAEIIGYKKPEKPLLAWDDRIEIGRVVIKPVTAKQEFDDGQGDKLTVCHHSDIKIFCKLIE